MHNNKLRLLYILSLLILASIIIYFTYGIFSGFNEAVYNDVNAKIQRMDFDDESYGNYSKISIYLFNNDTIDHFFKIDTLYNDKIVNIYNVTVKSNNTFQYSRDVLHDKEPIYENGVRKLVKSNVTNSTISVYIDNNTNPIEKTTFLF